MSALLYLAASAVIARPVCQLPGSDPDGDGYGWENNQTCLVGEQSTVSVVGGLPLCRSASSDSDGDGYGWEANNSCRVASSTSFTDAAAADSESGNPQCTSASVDPDGDGYGWENNRSCVVVAERVIGSAPDVSAASPELLAEERVSLGLPACSDKRFDPDNDGYGWENSRGCTFHNAGDGGRSITDIILVTGQSNALGSQTTFHHPYDPQLDSPVRRVYAYSQNGWGIAGLQQIWDRGWYPRNDIHTDPANNFAFHFGKSLVRSDPDAVVGIIMVTQPGAGISHWDRDGSFFTGINNRVRSALQELPGNPRVRGILWHQGETDYYSNDYYRNKLRGLIANFRAQSWHAPDAVFICGETLNAPVNAQLDALNTDADPATACVSAAGLDSIGDDIHFSADSLRTLGDRYARKYREIR